jgi:hypothetical protein
VEDVVSQRPDETGVAAVLLRVADELYVWWSDALDLRVSRDVWTRLAPALTGDHLAAASSIRGWYRDSMLVRCRRLLAAGDRREESPRRTLEVFASVAERVTVELLADVWLERGTAGVSSVEDARSEVAASLAAADERGPRFLDPGSIRSDAERLRADHEQVSRYASRAVAHLDRRRHRTEVPTWDDVDQAVTDVLAIVQRYAAVLAGVHLVTAPPRLNVKPTATALEVFAYRGTCRPSRARCAAGLRPPRGRRTPASVSSATSRCATSGRSTASELPIGGHLARVTLAGPTGSCGRSCGSQNGLLDDGRDGDVAGDVAVDVAP